MNKFFFFAALAISSFFLSENIFAQVKKAAANAYGLSGTKSFSLQWLGKDKYGKLKIAPTENGRFTMKGELEVNGDYCSIDGFMIPKDLNSFQFFGTIETQVSYLNGGQVCRREVAEESPYLFLKKNGRKYFRLQQMQTCDSPNTVDYIDVFEW